MDRINQYIEQCNVLFENWKNKPAHGQVDHRNGVFIADGVVLPEQWFSQDIRPLFLLKEAYNGESDWSLTDHLLHSKKKCNATWRRITQWTEGLLNTTADAIHPYTKVQDCTFGNEYLKRIAAINIKKSGGQKTSDGEDLKVYAQYDRTELYEQLKLADPSVIVCGYTMEHLNLILPEPIKTRAGQSQNLYYYTSINGHDVLVLDYWHPSNQYPDIMNYYTLMSIYQQALRSAKSREIFE